MLLGLDKYEEEVNWLLGLFGRKTLIFDSVHVLDITEPEIGTYRLEIRGKSMEYHGSHVFLN